MRTAMSPEEFAALVRLEPAQIEDWSALGLLDPAGDGRFDDLDLLRLMAIRHYEALGYDPERFAKGLAAGELRPWLGEYIYPRGEELSVDEAAARLSMDPGLVGELLTALGWARGGFLEEDLRMLEGFKTIADAGMP